MNASEGPAAIVRSYQEWIRLKQLDRRGWLRAGIPADRCESVADHSFAVALLAALLLRSGEEPVNPARALTMALIHDLGETHAGDITPHDGIDRATKHATERTSVLQLTEGLGLGTDLRELWDDYERGESPEARFVRQVDRLEMALQALSYEREGLADLGEFFESVRTVIQDPALCAVLALAETLRPARGRSEPG